MQLTSGQTAVVTGAGSGIGRALALAFAARGCRLVLADVDTTALQAVAAEAQALGAEVLALPTDVSERAAVWALADAAFERFGAVHVLCNNAGVAVGGSLQNTPYADWQWVLGVNLWGVIHGIESFVPRMIAAGAPAHIVNTASMAGLIASKGLGVYNTSKYAVTGLSETLARDLRDTGIGVSVLCPMGVQTRINESERSRPAALPAGDHSEAPPPLLGRWIEPDAVAAQVLAAIESGRLYILTHHEGKAFWLRRAERVAAEFPAEHTP